MVYYPLSPMDTYGDPSVSSEVKDRVRETVKEEEPVSSNELETDSLATQDREELQLAVRSLTLTGELTHTQTGKLKTTEMMRDP